MRHTPTHWKLNQPELNKVRDRDGKYIAAFKNDIDAIRAVVCVNACEGMEDPVIDIPALIAENQKLKQGIKDAIAEMEILEQKLSISSNHYEQDKAKGFESAIEILTDKTNTP